MSKKQHTGGKWVWSGLQLLASFDGYSEPVLIAEDEPFAPSPEDRVLIAAAPDLLAALQWVRDNLRDTATSVIEAYLDAAISRATEAQP